MYYRESVLTTSLTSPVSYPIPDDGPVGKLIQTLNRHIYRPSHIHIMVKVRANLCGKLSDLRGSLQAGGFETLVTALYPRGDKFLGSDAVFGVKSSLVVVSLSILPPLLVLI